MISVPRIAASSYSNTAPLIWSFLYGSMRGSAELIMDTAPARSAELFGGGRVDAALVPVIASQLIEGVKLVPNICVGAKRKVQSVCLVTKGEDLGDVRTACLDVSSRTSAVLTKIIFREFLGFEPEWRDREPNVASMLSDADCALMIGDPAFMLNESSAPNENRSYRKFDLAEIWHQYTGLGFVFAMWMTRKEKLDIDLASARDEGLQHLNEIAANYAPELQKEKSEMLRYLGQNISYSVDESMQRGLELYLALAAKHHLIPENRPLEYI